MDDTNDGPKKDEMVSFKSKSNIDKTCSCIDDKSTLYSSYILGKKWNTTIIFGGTALGNLIIWKINDNSTQSNIIHRLTGHNVISIKFKYSIKIRIFVITILFFFCCRVLYFQLIVV